MLIGTKNSITVKEKNNNNNKYFNEIFFSNRLMKIKILEGEKHIIFLKDQVTYKRKKNLNKAIFFDRDGVLIKDMHYIKDSKYVSLMKGVKEILNYTNNLGYLNIVITNQSGISRNLFTWEDYESVTNRMLAMINMPGIISAIYANGEGPNELKSDKSWRKPNPNMIIKASQDFNIDLSKSFLVGDRLSDIQAGYKAGLMNLIHVLTGHGEDERKKVIENYSKLKNNLNLRLINDLSYLNKIVF